MAMVFLKLSLLLLSLSVHASYQVELSCSPEERCRDIVEHVKVINKKEFHDEADFLNEVKALGVDEEVRHMSVQREDGVWIVEIERSPLIEEVIINSNGKVDVDRLAKVSQLVEGVPYRKALVDKSLKRVREWLIEDGYLDPLVSLSTSYRENKATLQLNIDTRGQMFLRDVTYNKVDSILLNELLKTVNKSKGKRFNEVQFKRILENISTSLKSEGFVENQVAYRKSLSNDGSAVDIDLNIIMGNRYQFNIYGNKFIDRSKIRETISKEVGEVVPVDLAAILEKKILTFYRDMGYYDTSVKVSENRVKSFEGASIKNYLVNIKEGRRLSVKAVNFLGNSLVNIDDLSDFYYENASVLMKRGFLDETFVNSFRRQLKEFYLRRGFVFSDVLKPEIIFDSDGVTVNFFIKERQQSILKNIITDGLNGDIREKVLKSLTNKIDQPLNVIELENDMTRSIELLRSEGYFYAKFNNRNKNNVVRYDANFSKSKIYLDFTLGKQAVFEDIFFTGNIITKEEVLTREIFLKKGDIITPRVLKSIRDNLNSLGIFSKVVVTPVIINQYDKTDKFKVKLIVRVNERALGRVEIAPGFRTDLGAKFTFNFLKNNLWGLNHSFNAQFQVNRRFSFRELDLNRLGASPVHKMEGLAKMTYSWPYLFKGFNFDSALSFQRRRFFSFDADIIRISPQISKQFNRYFGTSLKYQFEQIRQFTASNSENNATFRIGGITPSVTLDFRDNSISPRSGSYFGLSWEFANPFFGSKKDESIEINFSKLISRNRFYIPFFDKTFVMALSLAAGYQKNYATDLVLDASGNPVPISNSSSEFQTRGYIPSIKVFRLDGYDLVRGFADSEINRLDNGVDISQTRVQGTAYFTNVKIEPRYYLDDNLVLGAFFDAGRIFVDNYRPSDLRSALGFTVKVLTPVGSLDFDYGVKTRRRRFGDIREDFGRFHLNIGTF